MTGTKASPGAPGTNGYHVLWFVTQQKMRTLTIVLTARDTVEDRVYGLNEGGDDYLVTPCEILLTYCFAWLLFHASG